MRNKMKCYAVNVINSIISIIFTNVKNVLMNGYYRITFYYLFKFIMQFKLQLN